MPHYYFDTYDGREWIIDDIGLEIENLEQARKDAHHALADIAKDELPDGEEMRMAVRVRDEAGEVVIDTALDLKTEKRA